MLQTYYKEYGQSLIDFLEKSKLLVDEEIDEVSDFDKLLPITRYKWADVSVLDEEDIEFLFEDYLDSSEKIYLSDLDMMDWWLYG